MRKEILTNSQVIALLKAVCDTDFELLPYHVLCIFGGIRPKEVERLSWNNLSIAERFVEVPEEKSKSGMRRIVEMEPLLFRWLDYYMRAGAKSEGDVTPTSNLRKRLRAVRKAAGIERAPFDRRAAGQSPLCPPRRRFARLCQARS
jgi:integrase